MAQLQWGDLYSLNIDLEACAIGAGEKRGTIIAVILVIPMLAGLCCVTTALVKCAAGNGRTNENIESEYVTQEFHEVKVTIAAILVNFGRIMEFPPLCIPILNNAPQLPENSMAEYSKRKDVYPHQCTRTGHGSLRLHCHLYHHQLRIQF